MFFYDKTLFSQFVPDKIHLLKFFPDIHTARFDLMLNSKMFLNQSLIKLFKPYPNLM